jgi:hypothetical protein
MDAINLDRQESACDGGLVGDHLTSAGICIQSLTFQEKQEFKAITKWVVPDNRWPGSWLICVFHDARLL